MLWSRDYNIRLNIWQRVIKNNVLIWKHDKRSWSKNNYYIFVKNVRDINDYMNDIFSNNINKSRETNNKFKSKNFKIIVEYVAKNYRKELIFLEKTIKIENYSIIRFSIYIRQKILNENCYFKYLKKNIALQKTWRFANINQ